MVRCLLPARDPEEFAHFPKADVDFIRLWLNFSDDNIAALRRTVPLMGMVAVAPGKVDGTAAFTVPPSCAAGPGDGAGDGDGDNDGDGQGAAPLRQRGNAGAGRAAAASDPGPGFVFLFNPGYLPQNVTVVLDDRLSSYHPCLYAHGGAGHAGHKVMAFSSAAARAPAAWRVVWCGVWAANQQPHASAR